ncbi:hypothetical protein RRG08_055323 [Elysia crispata]|uniref:Uncharacterized protein n=1 Tax=Elysia crispata TaxID=231223 RepID=A0AAE1ARM1_9GAST|nr:hypothetical protein RRG08_055323 [Elysia crispata]
MWSSYQPKAISLSWTGISGRVDREVGCDRLDILTTQESPHVHLVLTRLADSTLRARGNGPGQSTDNILLISGGYSGHAAQQQYRPKVRLTDHSFYLSSFPIKRTLLPRPFPCFRDDSPTGPPCQDRVISRFGGTGARSQCTQLTWWPASRVCGGGGRTREDVAVLRLGCVVAVVGLGRTWQSCGVLCQLQPSGPESQKTARNIVMLFPGQPSQSDDQGFIELAMLAAVVTDLDLYVEQIFSVSPRSIHTEHRSRDTPIDKH